MAHTPHHVWTYAAGFSEEGVGTPIIVNCPCNSNIPDSVPVYVGNNYYCEAAFIASNGFGIADPLWDGN